MMMTSLVKLDPSYQFKLDLPAGKVYWCSFTEFLSVISTDVFSVCCRAVFSMRMKIDEAIQASTVKRKDYWKLYYNRGVQLEKDRK